MFLAIFSHFTYQFQFPLPALLMLPLLSTQPTHFRRGWGFLRVSVSLTSYTYKFDDLSETLEHTYSSPENASIYVK